MKLIDYLNEYLDFYVCNLNSTGNKLLYSTQASSSNQDYTFVKIGRTVYLVCYDGTNLVIVNTKTKSINKISNSVTSVAFKEQTTYNENSHSVADFDSYVYYTCANQDENASGNVLAKAKITTGESTVLDQNNNNTYEVFGIAGSDLIYGLTDALINASKQAIYKDNLSSKTRLYTNSFENVYVAPSNGTAFNGIVCTNTNGVYFVTGENQVTTLINSSAKVLGVTANYIYTLEDNKIYKRAIADTSNKVLVSGEAKVDTAMLKHFSAASIYAFFYAGYEGEDGTSYYLTMSDTSIYDENKSCTANFIGLFMGNDKPVETYNEEE